MLGIQLPSPLQLLLYDFLSRPLSLWSQPLTLSALPMRNACRALAGLVAVRLPTSAVHLPDQPSLLNFRPLYSTSHAISAVPPFARRALLNYPSPAYFCLISTFP